MNQWGNDQWMMPMMAPGLNMGPGPNMGPGTNMGMGSGPNMGMGPGHNMGMGPGPNMGTGPNMGPPALLPTPGPPGPDMPVPPLAPPSFLVNEWSTGNHNNGGDGDSSNFIGPKKPDIDLTNDDDIGHGNKSQNHGNDHSNRNSRDNREPRDGRRDFGDRDRDRSRRQRSPHRGRDTRDRNERSRSDRRERRPRWSDNKDQEQEAAAHSMMMPGNNNMMQTMMPGMMPNMQNMMPGMMQNMPGMMQNMSNMMPGMNMMPNMMDQNMMMMQQMPMSNQPICISCGVLLPPLPNATMPSRRERPPGCRTIFVGGLPNIGDDAIREIFERFGIVDDVKLHKQGVCHVRFHTQELVEASFFLSGFRFKRHDQLDNEATSMFIDYALNRDDQNEYERNKRKRTPTPPRIEPYTPAMFTTISDKIKSDTDFSEAAPTLAGWLERGECNKKNANAFYSLIQASNNQIRRLYTEKMTLDEEFQTLKGTMKDKFMHIMTQFEQVGKILTVAKIQRVSDHFSKQQRRNIEMWLKMTEDVENIKEEFNSLFDEDEGDEKKGAALIKKIEELSTENENLQYELEGYRNEAHLAKDEAERKFEKFKAHFIAQQALQNPPGHQQVYPPLPPPPPLPMDPTTACSKPAPPPSPSVLPSEAKLISILTAFLLVHPLGATLDYLVSYVRSIVPNTSQVAVRNILQKYGDVFSRETSGVGANIEHKWTFVTYDIIKKEVF